MEVNASDFPEIRWHGNWIWVPEDKVEPGMALFPDPKDRHRETHGGHAWEIDVFHGENDGLVVAELELESESESFERPAWLGAEVSSDPRYFNSNLLKNPYKNWR